MELETFWEEEQPSESDERILKLEKEIEEAKALLMILSKDDNYLML